MVIRMTALCRKDQKKSGLDVSVCLIHYSTIFGMRFCLSFHAHTRSSPDPVASGWLVKVTLYLTA